MPNYYTDFKTAILEIDDGEGRKALLQVCEALKKTLILEMRNSNFNNLMLEALQTVIIDDPQELSDFLTDFICEELKKEIENSIDLDFIITSSKRNKRKSMVAKKLLATVKNSLNDNDPNEIAYKVIIDKQKVIDNNIEEFNKKREEMNLEKVDTRNITTHSVNHNFKGHCKNCLYEINQSAFLRPYNGFIEILDDFYDNNVMEFIVRYNGKYPERLDKFIEEFVEPFCIKYFGYFEKPIKIK